MSSIIKDLIDSIKEVMSIRIESKQLKKNWKKLVALIIIMAMWAAASWMIGGSKPIFRATPSSSSYQLGSDGCIVLSVKNRWNTRVMRITRVDLESEWLNRSEVYDPPKNLGPQDTIEIQIEFLVNAPAPGNYECKLIVHYEVSLAFETGSAHYTHDINCEVNVSD